MAAFNPARFRGTSARSRSATNRPSARIAGGNQAATLARLAPDVAYGSRGCIDVQGQIPFGSGLLVDQFPEADRCLVRVQRHAVGDDLPLGPLDRGKPRRAASNSIKMSAALPPAHHCAAMSYVLDGEPEPAVAGAGVSPLLPGEARSRRIWPSSRARITLHGWACYRRVVTRVIRR